MRSSPLQDGVKAWTAFMDQYFLDGDRSASYAVLGYSVAQTFFRSSSNAATTSRARTS